MTDQPPVEGDAESADDAARTLTVKLPDRWLLGLAAATAVVLAVAAGASFVYSRSTGLMTTILISVFLAFAMLPAVDRLTARGWRRGPATGLVMLIGIGIIAVPAGLVTAALTEAAPADQTDNEKTESTTGDDQ